MEILWTFTHDSRQPHVALHKRFEDYSFKHAEWPTVTLLLIFCRTSCTPSVSKKHEICWQQTWLIVLLVKNKLEEKWLLWYGPGQRQNRHYIRCTIHSILSRTICFSAQIFLSAAFIVNFSYDWHNKSSLLEKVFTFSWIAKKSLTIFIGFIYHQIHWGIHWNIYERSLGLYFPCRHVHI